jgi:hypothetical protein
MNLEKQNVKDEFSELFLGFLELTNMIIFKDANDSISSSKVSSSVLVAITEYHTLSCFCFFSYSEYDSEAY